MNLSGRTIGNESMPDTNINEVIDGLEAVAEDDSTPTTPSTTKKFGTLGEAGQDILDRFGESSGGRVGTNTAGTVITVNTGNLLGSSEDVQLAVAEALRQAQRKGINVVV